MGSLPLIVWGKAIIIKQENSMRVYRETTVHAEKTKQTFEPPTQTLGHKATLPSLLSIKHSLPHRVPHHGNNLQIKTSNSSTDHMMQCLVTNIVHIPPLQADVHLNTHRRMTYN